jgi:hypothetical protein
VTKRRHVKVIDESRPTQLGRDNQNQRLKRGGDETC